jgi:hypothetical protein
VTVLVNTDDPVTESRFMLRTVAVTVRRLSEELALQAITSAAAKALHLIRRSIAGWAKTLISSSSAGRSALSPRVLETSWMAQRLTRRTNGWPVVRLAASPSPIALLPPLTSLKAPAAVEAPPCRRGAAQRDIPRRGRPAGPAHSRRTHRRRRSLRDGKIVSAGPRKDLEIPAGAAVVSAVAVSLG